VFIYAHALSWILVSNYLSIGIPDVNMTRLMWRVANQEKFSQWVSPYLVVYINEGSQPGFATFTFQRGFSTGGWFYSVFQLERIRFLQPGVLLACIVVAAVLSKILRKKLFPADFWRIAVPAIILLLTSGAITIGFNQAASTFRYFVFTTPLLILIVVSAWYFVIRLATWGNLQSRILSAVAILLVCAALVHTRKFRGDARSRMNSM
jgi:hypothetical protein